MPYPHHLEAPSVQEAVRLAEALRHAGEYDIFRGQCVDWPMRPSMARRDAAGQEQGRMRLLEFAHFVESTPELAGLHGDRNAVVGIAQHYGIPTYFVDFSTEPQVAGWFASHGRPGGTDQPGVIYLAHEDYIEQVYRDRLPELKTVRVDVDNLWRLQAQAGLFLEMPFPDDPELDHWLAEAFGTIRFPYSGPLDTIPETAIYPDRKSRLEVLFDAYLAEERARRTREMWQHRGFDVVQVGEDQGRRRADSFVGGFVPEPHPSWRAPRAAAWFRPPAERFRRQDERPRLVLEIEPEDLADLDPWRAHRRWRAGIAGYLQDHDGARGGFVDFELRVLETGEVLNNRVHPFSPARRMVGQDLADCFDGLRLFPYSDEAIADAVALVATAWARVHGAGRDFARAVDGLLGDPVLIEMGLVEGGQHGQSLVPEADLVQALRGDILELLRPEYHEWVDQPDRLLHQVNEPSRLFDFDRFVDLFGGRVVPGQFLMRSREVVFFSPARVQRFSYR